MTSGSSVHTALTQCERSLSGCVCLAWRVVVSFFFQVRVPFVVQVVLDVCVRTLFVSVWCVASYVCMHNDVHGAGCTGYHMACCRCGACLVAIVLHVVLHAVLHDVLHVVLHDVLSVVLHGAHVRC